MRAVVALLGLMLVSACALPTTPFDPQQPNAGVEPSRDAAMQFTRVVEQMEPVAEAECRARTRGQNCDFLIAVDDTPGAPINAHQLLSRSGRPVLVFTYALIEDVRNADELAFVLGHEAAHHIAGHLAKQEQSARIGAEVLGRIAASSGGGRAAVAEAQELGAVIGARRYSKDFELEADALGTIITARAGFDPLRGAAFFTRLPDPGNQVLGTHPPNAQRLEVVRRTVAGL